ncbi:putative feruloyl esterase A, partial [Termitomyces sp. J132]
FDDLLHYFKYASSAYSRLCPRPNGNTLLIEKTNRAVKQFSNELTDIQGFVARDSHRKEIIVALRGSASLINFLLDGQLLLVPLVIPGVSAPVGVRVHSGFLAAWNSVVAQVLLVVTQQIKSHPGFAIVTVGHSLGGALATLAAVTLKHNFLETWVSSGNDGSGHNHPQDTNREVRTYSYGAPRLGNKEFAEYVNSELGTRAFRVVHTTDGVPTVIPVSLGYHHHGIEYWLSADPASKDTTFLCCPDGEDPTCSASIPSRGVTPAH